MADSLSLDLTDIDNLDSVSLSLDMNEISDFKYKSETSDLEVPKDVISSKILAYLEEEHREQGDLIKKLEGFEGSLDKCLSEQSF